MHYNFVEQIASILVILFLGGLYCAKCAAGLGLLIFVSRILFLFYLAKGGPGNVFRIAGALLGDIGILGLTVMSFLAGYKMINS